MGFNWSQQHHVLLPVVFITFDGFVVRGQGQAGAGTGLEGV